MTTSCCLAPAKLIESRETRDRVTDAVAGLGSEHRDAGPLADDLELGDGVGALQVGGDEQRGVALLAQPEGELAGERGLSGALQAGQQDHRRRGLGQAQPPGLAAEDPDELLVDDLDDLLGRVEGLGDLGADRALPDRATNSRTTGSATSASSRATRISVQVASTSASESRPLPRRFLSVADSRSESVANTVPSVSVLTGTPVMRSGTRPCPNARHGSAQGDPHGDRDLAGLVGRERGAVGADDVEHVDRVGAQRAHPSRADVDRGVGQRRPDPVQQTGPVVGPDLEHGRRVGGAGDDVDARRRRPHGRSAAPGGVRLLAPAEPVGDVQAALEGPAHVLAQRLGVRRPSRTRAAPSRPAPPASPTDSVGALTYGEPVQAEHAGHGGEQADPVGRRDRHLEAVRRLERA